MVVPPACFLTTLAVFEDDFVVVVFVVFVVFVVVVVVVVFALWKKEKF